jgi:hypothetical protein
VTYGLQKRLKPTEQAANGADPSDEDRLNGLSVTSREWETAKFKEDMERLPEVRTPPVDHGNASPCLPTISMLLS